MKDNNTNNIAVTAVNLKAVERKLDTTPYSTECTDILEGVETVFEDLGIETDPMTVELIADKLSKSKVFRFKQKVSVLSKTTMSLVPRDVDILFTAISID